MRQGQVVYLSKQQMSRLKQGKRVQVSRRGVQIILGLKTHKAADQNRERILFHKKQIALLLAGKKRQQVKKEA